MQNQQYAANFKALVKVCKEKNIAIQAIKTIARGPKKENTEDKFSTWYEPLCTQSEVDVSLHWAMGNEDIFINSAADINLLPRILDAATRFTVPPSEKEMKLAVGEMGITPLFV